MKWATTEAEFARAPVGRFVRGERYLVWCAAPDLWGTVLWGSPSESDLLALCPLWDALRSMRGPFDILSDNRRVVAVDRLPFGVLLDYASTHREELAAKTRAHAHVRPLDPMQSSTLGGLTHLFEPPFRWTIVDTSEQAFAWLERPDGTGVAAELEAALAAHEGGSLFVTRARAYLVEHPRATIDGLGAHNGMSRRSVQRHLREAGVTFRDVLESARVERARRHLVGGDDKIDEVARRAGYKNGSQLARAFRNAGLAPPSDHRRR